MIITLQPEVLQWARERAQLDVAALAKLVGTKSEKVEAWEDSGELTYKQAEKVATKTRTAFGYLFLDTPPVEKLPIPDFRTIGSKEEGKPSRDLLAVIHTAELRQSWYRQHMIDNGAEKLPFVGSASSRKSVSAVAEMIHKELHFRPLELTRGQLDDAIRALVSAIEAAGIIIIRSGTVGNDTRRPLSTDEFRGFALVDDYAPLIFINSADSPAAQIFTIAHELAHIWLGQSALSNLKQTRVLGVSRVESFCNAVAAEYLVPEQDFLRQVAKEAQVNDSLVKRLRLRYRVSSFVIYRRLLDVKMITKAQFKQLYKEAISQLPKKSSGGGDFYNNQGTKLGKLFPAAIISSAHEGKTLYRDAFSLLNLKNSRVFDQYAKKFNFAP